MRPRCRAWLWVGLAVVWAGACSQEPGQGGEDEVRTLERAASVPQPERPFAPDPSETMLPGEQVEPIEWDEAEAHRSFESIREVSVPDRLRGVYEEAPVPVLLPADQKALATLEPVVSEHWYSALFEYRGREVTVEGDRVVRRTGEGSPAAAGDSSLDEGFSVSQTHGVLTVSFTSFGAAYTVDVECTEVTDRGSCRDEGIGLEVAENLARLGGDR